MSLTKDVMFLRRFEVDFRFFDFELSLDSVVSLFFTDWLDTRSLGFLRETDRAFLAESHLTLVDFYRFLDLDGDMTFHFWLLMYSLY